MLTATQREFLQVFDDANNEGKMFILDMVLCAAKCGSEFFDELKATPQEPVAIRAMVTKWKATIQ